MADVIIHMGKLASWSIYTEEEPVVLPQYVYYDDGVDYWRKGVRNSTYVVDRVLTETGFSGDIDIDWENVFSIS